MSTANTERSVARAAGVPWWGVASAAAAPAVLFTDWSIAAGLQHRHYNAVSQTFSVLAAHGAADRWVASLAFVLVGGLDIVTSLALRPAARAGRMLLAAGGATGVLVAASPETVSPGWTVMAASTPRHATFGAVGFVALTVWPLAAARRGKAVPWALRPGPALVASALTAAVFGWFLVQLVSTGAVLGLVERALGEIQALWPLAVVVSCLLCARRSQPSRERDLRGGGGPALAGRRGLGERDEHVG